MPSIAAVADVTCSTRSVSEPVGIELRIYGGALEHEPLARQPGTTMQVDDLFARFPARRKFLRARSCRSGRLSCSVVTPLALGFPEVQFTVLVDGREALRTPGDGELRNAAVAVLGSDAADHLLDVSPTSHRRRARRAPSSRSAACARPAAITAPAARA